MRERHHLQVARDRRSDSTGRRERISVITSIGRFAIVAGIGFGEMVMITHVSTKLILIPASVSVSSSSSRFSEFSIRFCG